MPSCRLDNWDKKCEDVLNKQINLELWASYQYLAMWNYFDKSSVGLKNIAQFFKKSSEEEREHAQMLMEYQNKRGGLVELYNVEKPCLDYLHKNSIDSDILLSFEKAVEMEQHVYKSLMNVHKVGEECNDPQFTDFIEGTFLNEQIEAINELTKYVSQLRRIGNNGHGVWHFDQTFSN
jgi:ferritin heavy chain